MNTQPKTLATLALFSLVLLVLYSRNGIHLDEYANRPAHWFAVFACSTPGGSSYRQFDYVFHLPLTALAWERIGFKSIVPIIGNRTKWQTDRLLSFVLAHLHDRQAEVLFVDAADHLQRIISQTVRIFAVNFDQFAAQPDDYLITSDADLWPLNGDHFRPNEHKKLILLHSQCCGFFQLNATVYAMYAMCNIGATVATWRQIVNDGHRWANDSASIMKYLEDVHGPRVRDGAMAGNWYVDQETISVRIRQWLDKYSNESVDYVSDQGLERIDRFRWRSDLNVSLHNATHFQRVFDAHLPKRSDWNDLEPLLQLMFGSRSSRLRWARNYVDGFNRIVDESTNSV